MFVIAKQINNDATKIMRIGRKAPVMKRTGAGHAPAQGVFMERATASRTTLLRSRAKRSRPFICL